MTLAGVVVYIVDVVVQTAHGVPANHRQGAFPPEWYFLYVRHEKSGEEWFSLPLLACMPAPPTLCGFGLQ